MPPAKKFYKPVKKGEKWENVPILFCQWEIEEKSSAPARRAFSFNGSVVCIHHCFYIAKAQAKAFYIVEVACMGTVKFFKDAA